MILKRIKFKNFMSFGDYWTELSFEQKGLKLIIGNNKDEGGSNGSGKTSILECICWILFGKTIRNIPIDKITNYKTGKNTVGELEIENGKNNYVITRYRNHDSMHNKLEIIKNGMNITKSTVTLTEELLYSEIPLFNWHAFTNSILFSSENLVNFIGLDHKTKRTILEKMLRLELFTEYQVDAKNRIKFLNDSITKLQSSNDNAKAIINSDKSTLIMYENKRNEFESKRLKIVSDCDNIIKNCSEIAIDEVIKVFEEIKQLQEDIVQNNKKIQELSDNEHILKIEYTSKSQKVETAENEIVKKTSKITSIQKLGGVCPTCSNTLTEEVKNRTINEYEKAKIAIQEVLNPVKDDIKILSEKLNNFKKLLNEVKDKNRLLSSKVSSMTPEYEMEEVMSIKTKIEQQQSIRDRAFIEKNPYEEVIQVTEEKITKALNDIMKYEEDLKELKNNIVYYDFWNKAFSYDGMKIYLLENIIPILNDKINYYLTLLFSSANYKVIFDKHLEESIAKNGVINLNYNMNSTGERRRIDLAISFAIFDVLRMQYGSVSNVLFFDEVFDTGLDGVGIQKVYNILRNSSIPSIYVISHKETMMENFDNVLEITCEKGLSRVT